MARLNINISDNLDKEMRDYIEKNNLTITTFLHLAISRYIGSQKEATELLALFKKLIEEELKTRKLNENIKE